MSERPTLSERKRIATRLRMADAAATLATERGVTGLTVDSIADSAEVGRATFFRYFNSKEHAVAEGLSTHWLDTITEALAAQPPELGPAEALLAAFDTLAVGFSEIEQPVRDLATLTRSSAALQAWTLLVYTRYEGAIADLLAPRFAYLTPTDPRPRLLGALAMATARIGLDDWLVHGGSLPDIIRRGLAAASVSEAPSVRFAD